MPLPKAVRVQRELLRLEDDIVRLALDAYDEARRDIVDQLLRAFQALGRDPDPQAVRELARDAGLIREIGQRIEEMGRDYNQVIRTGLSESQALGLELAEDEIARLVQLLNINVTPFTGLDPQLPGIIDAIMQQVTPISDQYRRNLTGQLLSSLARGDDFDTIVTNLLAAEITPEGASLARQARNSAELLARKTVIEANNASRQLYYEQARQDVDGLKKQAVAVVQSRTTKTCLRVHGQIKELEEPYVLTAKPRFARRMMYPPFHWRCRTSSAAYHPTFEENTRLTTASMRQAAQEELKSRE